MPLRKFRSVDEMPGPTWHDPADRATWRRIAVLWEFSARLCRLRLPPGVHKNRSIDEANRRREQWEAQRVRAARG